MHVARADWITRRMAVGMAVAMALVAAAAPTQEPAQEPIQEPTQEPAQEPVQEPAQEPAQEPVQEPAVGAREAARQVRDVVGIKLSLLESKIRRRLIRTSSPYGFLIRVVDPDSPAGRGGVRAGDLLMTWNGKPVYETTELVEWIQASEPGAEVAVELARRVEGAARRRDPWRTIQAALVLGPHPVRVETVELDRAALDRVVQRALEAHGADLQVSVWLGGRLGGPWYAWQDGAARPVASAIKPAYLVELFNAFAGALDAPPPGLEALLAEDTHPAFAPFAPAVRDEIRAQLGGESVRRIGEAMIRGRRTGGGGVSNAVYNAAANVATALLGGPEGCTARIHARAPAFAGIHARRYMLARRDVTGDNEATAAALAAVLQRLARSELPGVDARTVGAVRSVMFAARSADRGAHFFKGGSLTSVPTCRVRSGWWETDETTVVYVVMAAQPVAGPEAKTQLGRTTERLTEQLLEAVRDAARDAAGRAARDAPRRR